MGDVTLTEFLLARIAEDEADARARGRYAEMSRRMPGVVIAMDHPARALDECEAKRRIIERCTGSIEDGSVQGDPVTSGANLGVEVLVMLALPYADHPDYRDEWRP